MNPLTTSAFDLPDHLSPKADPTLIAGDEQHFAAIAESLEQSIADLSDRLDAGARRPARSWPRPSRSSGPCSRTPAKTT